MPKAAPFSPLRLISPLQLLFCFVLFFLPWIEMTCTMPPSAVKNMPKEEIEKAKKEMGIDPTKPISMVSQSGLQIATGGSSPGSDMKKIEAKMKESFKGGGATVETEKTKSNDDDVKGAPLLFLYPVLLLAGVAVAFIPMPALPRRLALAGCCGAALGVVALQALIGFPMANEIKKKNDEMRAMGGGGGFMFGPPGGGKAPGKDTKSDSKEADMVSVSWKFPLYLTILLLLGAAGTAFIDGAAAGGGRGRYGRKGRRDYDTDDDFYDDEDDRPRKRSRRDDYDDEDDRPRKKKQAEPMSLDDEDEPPPPPKKKPRDDDRYDDRPRKKRQDDDDFPLPESAAPPPLPPAAPPAPAGPNPFDFDSQEEPRKKPRRRDDDDDYDDRPRKKRRRDDDDY